MANEKDTIRFSINFVTVAHMIMDRPKWVSQQIKQIRSIINRIERLPNTKWTRHTTKSKYKWNWKANSCNKKRQWKLKRHQMSNGQINFRNQKKKIVNKIEEWRKKYKFNHATAACRTCNVADTHHAEPHRLICALWPLIVSSTKGRKGRETGAASTTCLAAPSSLCLPHSASDQTCYICVLYIDRHKHGGKTATFKCNLRQRLNNFRLSNADWLPRETERVSEKRWRKRAH